MCIVQLFSHCSLQLLLSYILSYYLNRCAPILPSITPRIIVYEKRLAFSETSVSWLPSGCVDCSRSKVNLVGILVCTVVAVASLELVGVKLGAMSALAGADTCYSGEGTYQLLPSPGTAVTIPVSLCPARTWPFISGPQDQQELHGLAEIEVTATGESSVFWRVGKVRDGNSREIHKILALRFHH